MRWKGGLSLVLDVLFIGLGLGPVHNKIANTMYTIQTVSWPRNTLHV